jgi:hypothetical protein
MTVESKNDYSELVDALITANRRSALPRQIALALKKHEGMGRKLAFEFVDLLRKGQLPQYAADFLAFSLENLALKKDAATKFFALKGANKVTIDSFNDPVGQKMMELINKGMPVRSAAEHVGRTMEIDAETARTSHKRRVKRVEMLFLIEGYYKFLAESEMKTAIDDLENRLLD